MTSFNGRERVIPVAVDHLDMDADGVQFAVLATCPICGADDHRHVLPADVLPSAPLIRVPRCRADRGLVRLVLGGERL